MAEHPKPKLSKFSEFFSRADTSGGHEPWSKEADELLSIASSQRGREGKQAADELWDRFGHGMDLEERAL
jgi:hypothetical protein